MYSLLLGCMILTAQARNFASAPCFDDSHCPDDHYCETSGSFCRQCLQCKDFRREGPSDDVSCVKAVTKCGPCLDGYIDRAECVPPDSWWHQLPYTWVISALVLVALLVCVAIICVLWKFRVYTLRATVSTKQSNSELSMTATAPAPPPPYNSVAAPPNLQILNREASLPYVIPVPNKADARESTECQTATLSRPPLDGFGPDSLPPRYESPSRELPDQLEVPNNETFNNGNGSSNNVSASVEATDPDCPTSARKSLRVRQDSTNSDTGEPSGRNSGGRPLFNNTNYSPLIINVIKSDNIVQQNNDNAV